MSLANRPLLSGQCFRAAMEMAVEMPREDIERNPMVLALMLCSEVDGIKDLTDEQMDLIHRVLACLIVDWSERIDGGGTEAIHILLAAQDTNEILARARDKRP